MRPPGASSDSKTRERLLDKAEELFAQRGFETVSLRDLTQAAGTNLAAVNYHFGSKERLIDCIIERALNPINEERLALLAEARKSAGPSGPSIEVILQGFLEPVVRRIRRSAMPEKLFFKLMGRCLMERANQLPASTLPLLGTVIAEFSKALRQCSPGLDLARVMWRLNFTIGALVHTLIHGELIERITQGAVGAVTADKILKQLIEFCAAGFHESIARGAPRAKKTTARGRGRAAIAMLAAAGSMFLANCGAMPPKSRMNDANLPVPAAWSASREAKAGVDVEWVRRFRDAELNRLVDEAIRNNRDLKAAAARVERARGEARMAGVAARPTSDLTFDAVRSKRNFIGFPIGGPEGSGGEGGVFSSQFNTFDLNLDIKWELDIWGRIAAGKSAALGFLEASEFDERAAHAALAAQVGKTWFLLVEAERQTDLAEEAQAISQSTAEAVRERFKAGNQEGGAGAQLRLAESDTANARAAAADRRQQAATAKRQLEILLGRYPSGNVKSDRSLPEVPARPPAGLPSELLQRRPDVIAAERRFAAQGKRLIEARRALFPRLSLTASGGTSTDDLAELLNSDFGVWQLAGNVIQPVLTGGALRAEADIRRAEEKEALAQLQQIVLQAFSEVEIALAADQFLATREAAITEAARLAEEADKAARADYRDGVGDILTVFAAQTRMIQARSQWITVRRLRLENRINLHLALGGDFQARSRGASSAARLTGKSE